MKIKSLLFATIIFSGFLTNVLFAQAVKQIYWADSGDRLFKKAGIDGSEITTLWDPNPPAARPNINKTIFGVINVPMDIDVDFISGKVYGITSNGIIFKRNLDGSNLETVNTGILNTFGIALDRVNNKLYFTSQAGGSYCIRSISTSLVGGTTLILGGFAHPPQAIAVDPNGGKIYFSLGDGRGEANPSIVGKNNSSVVMNGLTFNSICKADLDGENSVAIIINQTNVFGIDLDLTNNKIYWTNYSNPNGDEANKNIISKVNMLGNGTIRTRGLAGGDIDEILSGLTRPFGISLDVAGGKLYWSEAQADTEPNLGVVSDEGINKNSSYERNIMIGSPLWSANLDGSNPAILFTANNPSGIQIEPTNVQPSGPPVVEGVESSALIYTEGDGAVPITGTIRVSDPANANIQSATIAISANFRSDQDILHFTNTGGITGTYNQSSGTLILSGGATPDAYTNALRSVTYENTSENPAGAMGKVETSQTNSEVNTLPRMVIFYVSNGEQQSGIAYRNIIIIPINDAPEISGMTSTLTLGCGESVEVDVYGKVHDAESSDRQLTYEFTPSNNSVQVSFDTNTGKATVTASQGFSGNGTIKVKVTDPEGAYAEYTITFTVTCTPPTGVEAMDGIPKYYELEQNYPNPFNPSTTIQYGLPKDSHVRVVVYDMLGQQVAILVDQYQSAGYHEVIFEADGLDSGMYLYKIQSGDYTQVRKMIFLK
ncbi:MAG: hypothetical protein A2V66_02320 [Ignavibacteria bacterium RBG_13_36_8]|nr:MAG: hypothetical protein A2V66_02320 [Ignavibacteria bacterium RBG_13_36_8]